MSAKACCFCFSIQTGVKLIAALYALGTIGCLVQGALIDGFMQLYLPIIVLYGSFSIAFTIVLLKDRIQSSILSRTVLLIANVILILLAARIYYLIITLNGSVSKVVCQNNDSSSMYVTVDFTVKCEDRVQKTMLADIVIGWIFEIYFAYILLKYRSLAEDFDGYKAE